MPENITKLKDTTLARCCDVHEVLPTNVSCFAPDIYAELHRLKCRHKYAFVKRKRLMQLAEPRCRVERYTPKCGCKFGKNIEMVHLERQAHTRTEQLAYPSIRRILLFKKAFKHLLSQQRLEILNRLARYSLFSLYSRLQNVHPPLKTIPIKKWDAAEWKTHTKYFKKLAKPKKEAVLPKLPNPKMPLNKMKRYIDLAKPVERAEWEKLPWYLTAKVENYKASKRIVDVLSKPIQRLEFVNEYAFKVHPDALTRKATERVINLAKVVKKQQGESDLRENPFKVSPNAIRYKDSDKWKELATAKSVENVHIRANPQLISPAALKAKASPRIIELAKPKEVYVMK